MPYEGTMVVNNPLVWPYFLRGWHVGGTLRSHEYQSHFMTSSLRDPCCNPGALFLDFYMCPGPHFEQQRSRGGV